ncbi:MAG: hypothetical protein M4579_004805 [Chaenotheca gracillima]|nr:MAG: hypothetical protein M4579_004805 [Chaenotheca gracillima]
MSDLHLEVGLQYGSFHIPYKAPYLVLAGDIGRLVDYEAYLGFLRRQCGQFVRVFLVLGNHEFFGMSRAEGLQKAILVVTHHAPCVQGTSKPSDVSNPWSSAFATDLFGGEGINSSLSDVQCWIFGHTHYTTEFSYGTVKLVSNQRGYVLPGREDQQSLLPSTTLQSLLQRFTISSSPNKNREFDTRKVVKI